MGCNADMPLFSFFGTKTHFQRRNWTPQAMLYLKGARKSQALSVLRR